MRKSRTATLEQRVRRLRSLVYRGMVRALDRGLTLQSFDGQISTTWPSLLSSRPDGFLLNLSCSVLDGPSKHFSWRGRTWAQVFRKAERDVGEWVADLEGMSK